MFSILCVAMSQVSPGYAAHKDFDVRNDANSLLFVSGTSGNVGIGTIIPVGKLNIEGGSAVSARIVNVGGTFADLTGSRTGLYVDVTAPVTGAFGATGSWSQVRTTANSNTYSSAIAGAFTEATHEGAATVSDLMGIMTLANSTGTGTVTNAFGIFPQVWKGSAPGTIQNAYGLYYQGVPHENGDTHAVNGTVVHQYGLGVGHMTEATTTNIGILLDDDTPGSATTGSFGILQESAEANSFEGNMGVGTTEVNHQLVLRSTGETLIDSHQNEDMTGATAIETQYKVGKSTGNRSVPGSVQKFRFFAGYGGFQEVGQIAVTAPSVSGGIVSGAVDVYSRGQDGLVKRMTIDEAKTALTTNLGIGTTAPVAALQVGINPTVTAGSSPVVAVKGNVMIDGKIYGDGSALTSLPAGGAAGSTTQIQYNNAGNMAGASGFVYDANANVGISTTAPVGLLDINRKLNVLSSGNVGIGTTAPLTLLEVGVQKLSVSSAGNVGIGTILPRSKLEVSGAYFSSRKTVTPGTPAAIDWSTGNVQYLVLTSGVNTVNFSNPVPGGRYLLELKQPAGVAPGTVTWDANVRWPSGTAPTLTTTYSYTDIITFYYNGTNYAGSASFNYNL